MRKILLAMLFILCAGCTHITLRYRANVDTYSGLTGQIRYTKSFDLHGSAIACGLTSWLYGGWCWYYANMPTSEQREAIKAEAEDYVAERTNEPFSLTGSSVVQLGWTKQETSPLLKLVKAEDIEQEEEKESSTSAVKKRLQPPLRNHLERKHKIKLIMPYILGLGLAVENPVDEKVDLELGYGGTLNWNDENNTALYVQAKYLVAATSSYHLKMGYTGMKVFAESFGGYDFKYAANGFVIDYMSRDGTGYQFIHLPSIKGRTLNILMVTYVL